MTLTDYLGRIIFLEGPVERQLWSIKIKFKFVSSKTLLVFLIAFNLQAFYAPLNTTRLSHSYIGKSSYNNTYGLHNFSQE
jgi:hypothetical protein